MLSQGFKEQIDIILTTTNIPDKDHRQTLLFSATFAEEIQQLAKKYLRIFVRVTVGKVGRANTDIIQKFILTEKKQDKLSTLLKVLKDEIKIKSSNNKIELESSILIFCNKKGTVTSIKRAIELKGYEVSIYI